MGTYICLVCRHEWKPRVSKPRQCPKCWSVTLIAREDIEQIRATLDEFVLKEILDFLDITEKVFERAYGKYGLKRLGIKGFFNLLRDCAKARWGDCNS